MEVRDSLLLLHVVRFCVGLVFVVIVGVCQGADIWYGFLVVPFQSARGEMCNWSEKYMWDASNL
jgi:hypothetical protein